MRCPGMKFPTRLTGQNLSKGGVMGEEIKATDLKELLLMLPNRKKETCKIKMARLSKEAGQAIYFELHELDYDEVAWIKSMGGDMDAEIVLKGVKVPDFTAREFAESQGETLAREALKKYLSPGEIEDVSRKIQKLSGYLSINIEEIKKK